MGLAVSCSIIGTPFSNCARGDLCVDPDLGRASNQGGGGGGERDSTRELLGV